MIKNLEELADHVGANNPTATSISRRVYKDTACVAWVSEEDGTVKIGSIVEGVERTTEVQELEFPFSEEEWDEAVQAVEDEAEEIWSETHGCEDCGEEYGGYRAVNPDCPSCGGQGTII